MHKFIPKVDDAKGRGGDLILAAVRSYLKAGKIAEFEKLESKQDQILFLLENKTQNALLQTFLATQKKHQQNVIGDTSVKDKVLAKHLRDAGNSAFGSGDDATALDCYNQSAILAPCDTRTMKGEDLSIAVANRAAVFLRQEKFTHCLKDIELALDTGYPMKLRHKLYQRHAKCLCEMYRFSEALKKFELAIESLEDSTLSKDQKETTKKELEASSDAIKLKHGLEKALNHITQDPIALAVSEEMTWKRPTFEKNSNFPNFTSELEVIMNSDTQERQVTVKTDHNQGIKAATVLGVEDCTVHYLYAESRLTHCSHCIVDVLVPVPCPGCINILFCSIKCRNLAWNAYHKYECEIAESVTSLYKDIFLVYRTICQIPVEELLKNKDYLLDSINRRHNHNDEVNENDTQVSNPKLGIFSLSLLQSESSELEERLILGTSATILLHYLKENRYFGEKLPTSIMSENDVFLGTLIYQLLQVAQYNVQEMYEIGNWNITTGPRLSSLGLVINQSFSLINHSCDPNTVRINYGKTSLLVATKNIHPGTEVCMSNSLHFQDIPLVKRQEYLKQYYHFECRCIPCSFNWPLQRDITTSVAKRGMGGKANEIKAAYANANKLTMHDVQGGYFDRVCTLWSEFYEEGDKILQQPHKCFIRAVDEIKNSLWLKYGNRVPRLQAPVYKDHSKEDKSKSDQLQD